LIINEFFWLLRLIFAQQILKHAAGNYRQFGKRFYPQLGIILTFYMALPGFFGSGFCFRRLL
jgi:hypothetical protein